jgi:hypothetical protein
MRNHHNATKIAASAVMPPTTPPAIAGVLLIEPAGFGDAGEGLEVPVGVVEVPVLIIVAEFILKIAPRAGLSHEEG